MKKFDLEAAKRGAAVCTRNGRGVVPLEKLERGEYGNHIEDKREMVAPAIKQNLNTDREYWRRVYAGHIAGGLASHNGLNIIGSEIIVAKASCSMADALIEELEKDEKVL